VDRGIVERARRGDRDAFTVLVEHVSDRLYAVAYRILRDAELAKDALQNALMTVWQQLPHLREADRFEAWSQRILVHACYAEARRRGRSAATVRVIPFASSASDGAAALADRDEMERAFRRISPEHRAVFVLHHYLGLPLVEVAETLGIPAGTARSRLHNASRVLRSAIEADAVPAVERARLA
jgi:RNA polymerase sigma-70 factor (ECF subfamily)